MKTVFIGVRIETFMNLYIVMLLLPQNCTINSHSNFVFCLKQLTRNDLKGLLMIIVFIAHMQRQEEKNLVLHATYCS